ncbi:MAG: helix-hairpin-helix domain-containing protein [Gammaproteobacteria bacterium]|nr:helix-hairpin-helix domain-containing protein [Gammaproteobacteria bacterium]
MNLIKRITLLIMLAFAPLAMAGEVDINTASAAELAEALVGVGDVKAEAIVAYREAHGPFNSADELTLVKGIGKALVDKNRENILISR